MTADDLLRTRACPRCAYPFDGLPAAPVCPECGRGHDGVTAYLFGEPDGPAVGWVEWLGKRLRRPGALRLEVGPGGLRVERRAFGPFPFESSERVAALPWPLVLDFELRVAGSGMVRVRCGNGRDFWLPIDVLVRCPTDAEPVLRQRIAEWRGAADRR